MKLFFLSTLALILVGCKAADEIVEEFVNYAEPPTETYSKPNDPARVLPPNPIGCPDWEKDTTVQITESTTLPLGCKYDRVSVLIVNKSDLVFDCNGAELNGLDKKFRQAVNTTYNLGEEPVSVGIQVQSSENFQSRNVTVKNCNLTNYVRGIRIHFSMSAASISDLKSNTNVEVLENHLRDISPKNIRIENSTVNFSHKDGIFVSRFITDFVLDNSSVNSTGAVGLYLDSGSANNTISNTSFTKNGYSDYDISTRTIKRKVEDYSREALAIDSSMNNNIEKNTFMENSRGSLFIYKNCNEHYLDPNQIPRYQSADNNIVTDNSFDGDRVGVWIASRQSADLKALECAPPIVATGSISYGPVKEDTEYYEDFAKNNQVLNNTFSNLNAGIIVEDDNSVIQGNMFTGTAINNIIIGTRYRTGVLSHPVTNTTIDSNQFNSTTTTPISLVYNPVGTVIINNFPADLNN